MKKIMLNDRYSLTEAVIEGRKTVTRMVNTESASKFFGMKRNQLKLIL